MISKMNKTTEQFNSKMLGLFYAQTAQAGKPLPHAPQWDEHKKQREVELAKREAAYWEMQSKAHETLCSLFRGDHLATKNGFKKIK